MVLGPGNGEALLLKVPPNQFVIIDSFLRPKQSTGACPVLELFDRMGGELSCAILTHSHADHAEGFERVAGRCAGPIGVVEMFLPNSAGKWDAVALQRRGLIHTALNAINDRWETDKTTRWPLQAGDQKQINGATLTILHPCQQSMSEHVGFNELSSPVLVEWESVRLILGADLPTDMWPKVASNFNLTDHHGLKVPHHASKDGFHPNVHGPGLRERYWVATPYKRGLQPPRFEDGEGVSLILGHVDVLHFTSILFETPATSTPIPRSELLKLATNQTTTLNLPGAPAATPVADPKDPDVAWVAASWKSDGTLSNLQSGDAAVRVCEN